MAQITQTINDTIFEKIVKAASSKGITPQALIAYHLGEIYGDKQAVKQETKNP